MATVASTRRGLGRRGGWFAALLWVHASAAVAAEWYVQPVVRTELETNDNRALTTGPHERVNGVVVDASARMAGRTERQEFQVTPRLHSARYSGGDDFDTDDAYLDGSWSSQISERDTWLLVGNYARNSTLTTE